MSKRIVFPKNLFERNEALDFSDDGTRFRGYKYKNTVPITYTRFDDEVFCSIRMDYMITFDDYRAMGVNFDIYNGVDADRFDMNTFIETCEKAYQYLIEYNSPEATKARITKKIFKIDERITKLIDQKTAYIAELSKI